MAQDDRILLDQWSKLGDGGAFRTLVSRYSGVVYAACRRILGNPSDAEDIAQECFEALAAAGTKPGAYVGAWLHRVATYHAIGHVRGEVRRKKRESQYSSERPTRTTLEWKDIYEYVDEAVDELPDKLRLPLIAHYLEGQSKESVGMSLGISRPLADYRIQKGLKRVREALQRKGVYVGAGLLAGLMEANAAEAAPAEFVAKLGKIALAGPGTSAPVAALGAMKAASCVTVGGAALKIVIGTCVAALLVALGVFFGWKEIRRPYRTQDITAKSTFSVQESVPVEKRIPSTAGKTERRSEQTTPTEAAAPAVLTLEPGAVFYGVVLDENRRPVPGATVRLDNQDQVERFALDEKQDRVGFFASTASIDLSETTDARGEFAFERVVVPEREGLVLSARAGDRYAIRTISEFGEVRQRRQELILERAGVVKGRIVDEKSKGLPDIRVNLSPQRMVGEIRSFEFITKEDGSFESRPVPLGMYEVLFSAPGFKDPGRPWFNADGQVHVIRLERAGPVSSISGWVVNVQDGRRLPGVVVTADIASATTNDNGEFSIAGLPAKAYLLSLGSQSAPYVLADAVRVTVESGRDVSGIELKAVRGATVTGRITEAETNEPSPKAHINVMNNDRRVSAMTTADDKGQYTLTGLAEGTYKVWLARAGGHQITDGAFTLSPLRDMTGVDFVVGPFRSIRGKVTNSSGTPVAGASVVVLPTVAFVRLIGTSDASGAFDITLDEKIPSAYLQAYGDGCVSRCLGPIRAGGTCDLELEESGGIEGVVVDSTGRPVPEAVVAAVSSDSEMITALSPDSSEWSPWRGVQGTKACTSSTGEFEMEPVLPGEYSLQVYLPSSAKGYPEASTTAIVQAGKTLQARLVVDLGGMGAIEGVVTQGGQPIERTIVEAYSDDRDWVRGAETLTDANGAYSLANIRPGEARVTAWQPGAGHRMAHKNVQVVENQVETVDFNFEQHEGGVEGTVTINGKPGYADIDVTSTDANNTETNINAMTSPQDGYYHVANLAPGTYTLRATEIWVSSSSRVPRESVVQVNESETVRCDFAFDSGAIAGTVQGLREGEQAVVGLFTEPVDVAAVSSMTLADLEARLANSATLQAGEPFKWESLQPGVYYLGVIAVPADAEISESALAASIAEGRFYFQPIEVATNETATVDVVLPKGRP